jgi:hypothetical protein
MRVLVARGPLVPSSTRLTKRSRSLRELNGRLQPDWSLCPDPV